MKQNIITAVAVTFGVGGMYYGTTNAIEAQAKEAAVTIIDEHAILWSMVLDGIRQVETGGEPDEGRGAVGDGGKSIGPYQIGKLYYLDAIERLQSPPCEYEDLLHDLRASEHIIAAYMQRYAPGAYTRLIQGKGTPEDVQKIARIHNGGPAGNRKPATRDYASKVLSWVLD